jgi:hypothetical protein
MHTTQHQQHQQSRPPTQKKTREVMVPKIDNDKVKVECSELIESYLQALETGPKPFFLSTIVLYKWIKIAASTIPSGSAVFEQLLSGIVIVTEFVQSQTDIKVLVIKDTDAEDLVSQLDGVVTDLLIRLDDGFDNLRVLLVGALR